MKSICLVGFGAEIGATLLGMNKPDIDGYEINDVITRAPIWDDTPPIQSIFARLCMAVPRLWGALEIIDDRHIKIHGRKVKFHFLDLHKDNFLNIGNRFDACILATSKKDISDLKLLKKLQHLSPIIVSVAESDLPESKAFYTNLQDMKFCFPTSEKIKSPTTGIFHFGSCQSNGWHATLRVLMDCIDEEAIEDFHMLSIQSDIVHPDTPTGTLGTRTMNPRDQEARNNLRPGFSQIRKSMDLLFPDSKNLNTTALRTLIEPPGYQINRFIFSYAKNKHGSITYQKLINTARKIEASHPHIIACSDYPLGSKAFSELRTAAVLLLDEKYFIYNDSLGDCDFASDISMLIVQSYVDNVGGYCGSVLTGLTKILSGETFDVF